MDGIIPLMKPKSYTSHDCVQVLRGITGMKKVGHTGTLDPNVEGVLPICLGEATKTIPYLQQLNKVYIAEITLGIATTTEDADGDIVKQATVDKMPSDKMISTVLASFIGQIKQVPPMYSAVRVNGKRLYEYARENIEVERPERTVDIYRIKRTSNRASASPNSFTIIVNCSKGTYIRTLAVDIGKQLGFPAHMSFLKRIETDSFTIEETSTFEQIEKAVNTRRLHEVMFPVERGLEHLPVWEVDEQLKRRVLLGQKLPRPQIDLEAPFTVMHKGKLLAIYQYHELNDNEIKPVRVFNMYKNEGELK